MIVKHEKFLITMFFLMCKTTGNQAEYQKITAQENKDKLYNYFYV